MQSALLPTVQSDVSVFYFVDWNDFVNGIYFLRASLIVLYTIFWGLFACVVGLVDRSGAGVVGVARIWAHWILATCKIKIEAHGIEQIPRDQPVIFMSNHRSALDVLVLVKTLPVPFRFVAKKELRWIPLFGWALFLGRHVFVDRENRIKAIQSLTEAAERVRSGTNVILYPEGTRSRTTELLPFKSGSFHMALDAGVLVVPVSVSGSQRLTPKGSSIVRSGTIRIVFGKPIASRDFDFDRRYLFMETVRQAILAGLANDLDKVEGP